MYSELSGRLAEVAMFMTLRIYFSSNVKSIKNFLFFKQKYYYNLKV